MLSCVLISLYSFPDGAVLYLLWVPLTLSCFPGQIPLLFLGFFGARLLHSFLIKIVNASSFDVSFCWILLVFSFKKILTTYLRFFVAVLLPHTLHVITYTFGCGGSIPGHASNQSTSNCKKNQQSTLSHGNCNLQWS